MNRPSSKCLVIYALITLFARIISKVSALTVLQYIKVGSKNSHLRKTIHYCG